MTVINKIKTMIDKSTELAIFLLTIILMVIFSMTTKNFLTVYNLLNLLKQSAVIGIISVALTFIFISGKVDLSVGAVAGLSAMICAIMMSKFNLSPLVSILIGIVCGTTAGLINAVIVYELRVMPFIATLGMANALRGITKYISGAQTIANLHPSFNKFAISNIFGISPLVYVWVFIAVLAFFVMKYTKFGRCLYVCGSSNEVARLSGINTRAYTYYVYIISGFLCSIAGILMTTRLNSAVPTGGTGFEMNAIASAVVGGVSMSGATGTPFGAVAGTLLIMTIQNGGIHLGIDPFIMESINGFMVIFAVYFNIMGQTKNQ